MKIMISRVLADYKATFRLSSVYTTFFICFIGSCIIGSIAFLPFPYLLALDIYEEYEMKQNKLFYIIPLSLNERKKYYKARFLINLIIPESIQILIGIILIILGKLELRFFIFVLISLSIYIICKNLDIRKYLKNNRKLYWDKFYWYGISMKISELLCFASLYYAIGYSMKGEYYGHSTTCILVLIIFQLWILKSVLGYRKNIIEFIINPS
ncbi:MAG: hypothetical protein ACI4PU_09355 [Intestinibacter sp.]